MEHRLENLNQRAYSQLVQTLEFWLHETTDQVYGGFIGQIDYRNHKNPQADKGAVLNARILWSFSAAHQLIPHAKYFSAAHRAFDYIENHFLNHDSKGLYWSVDYKGRPKETKNQTYALAFMIYGLSEFYKISAHPKALEYALTLYQSIEEHTFDKQFNGYIEALDSSWNPLNDLRLSEKDQNTEKTFNTHLHIVEAYANLYQVWPDPHLKERISNLLQLSITYFVDPVAHRCRLFFDRQWNETLDHISFGHDIEASWLLTACAEKTQDIKMLSRLKKLSLNLVRGVKNAVDKDGGLWYEKSLTNNDWIYEKHWWCQAEFWIGMIHAWQLTGTKHYFQLAEDNFNFVEKYIVDSQYGEWIWGIDKEMRPIEKDKVGPWKCPYHNTRAYIELIQRLKPL